MKNGTGFAAGIGLLLTFGVSAVYAQPGALKAKVPFAFSAAGKSFPAGEYRLTALPHRVEIQDARGAKLAVLLANEISGSARRDGQIIFRCYAEKCVLAEVWSPDFESGQSVGEPSQRERSEKDGGREVALLAEKPAK